MTQMTAKNGFCSLGKVVIPSYCKSCKFGILQKCAFFHTDLDTAERHAHSNGHAKRVQKDNQEIEANKIIRVEQPNRQPKIPLDDELLGENVLESNKVTWKFVQIVFGCLAISAIIGFPLAYIGQVFQLLADFIFSSIGLIVDGDSAWERAWTPWKESFFYASYFDRYIYWVSFCFAASTWVISDVGSKWSGTGKTVIAVIATIIYFAVSIFNVNLLVSTIFGPVIIFFGLLLTARK